MANLTTRAVDLVAADLEARIRAGDATASAELRELVAQAMREAGPFIPTRGNGAPLLNQPIVRDFTPYNAGPAPSPFKPMVRDPGPYIAPRSRVVGADLFQPATSAVQPMIVNCARVAPFDSDATSLAGT